MCSTVKIVLLITVIAHIYNDVTCLPRGYSGQEEYVPGTQLEENVQYCYSNSRHLETCQRCAKQTKSPIVYPLCCTNQEQALSWCQQYTNFGIQTESKRDLMHYHRYDVVHV